MKKCASLLLVSVVFAAQQALACPFCYGAKDGKSTEYMAVAIWFLFGAVMSVIGGIGAFGANGVLGPGCGGATCGGLSVCV